jgi:hypothetical protein
MATIITNPQQAEEAAKRVAESQRQQAEERRFEF